MSKSEPIRPIIWRELLCRDAARSKAFYSNVFGWDFAIEHATEFAWGDGPGDYALIHADGAVHGGLAQVGEAHDPGWISYALTADVDRAVEDIEAHGGTIVRAPFEVEGVGRNAVALSPGGARFGVSAPSYDAPHQNSIFVAEVVLARESSASDGFFRSIGLAGENSGIRSIEPLAQWTRDDVMLPVIGAADCEAIVARSRRLGASPLRASDQPSDCIVLIDPTGALFGIVEAQIPTEEGK